MSFGIESYLAKLTASLLIWLVGLLIKVLRDKFTEREVMPDVYDNTKFLGDGNPKRRIYSPLPNKVWKEYLNPARHYIWWYVAVAIFIISTGAYFV